MRTRAPLDEMRVLQACDRARDRGVPFTLVGDVRDVIMRKLEVRGLVKGTRHADEKAKTFWGITSDGKMALANLRAQAAARDLAESIRLRGMS